MGTWFWLNIPLALLFICCWAGIPLRLTLTRWNAGLRARRAEVAATAAPRVGVRAAGSGSRQRDGPPGLCGGRRPLGR